MKKIILFTAFFTLICLTAFSQLTPKLKLNNQNSGISVFENRNPFYSAKSFDFTSILNDSVFNKKMFIPRIPDTHLFLGQITARKYNYLHSKFNMPCIKPQGNFSPMPIMRPYPWVQYSLLIKEE